MMKTLPSVNPRPIYFVDAIKVDWNEAIDVAKKYIDRLESTNAPFDKILESYEILVEIQHMYRDDNIDGYFNLMDKYGKMMR